MTNILSFVDSIGDSPPFLTEAYGAFTRPGKRFEPILERELDAPMRTLASTLPGARGGVFVLPEFAGPIGVADLVAVTRTAQDLRARASLTTPPIQSLTLAVVAAAVRTGRTTSVDHIARTLEMSDRQVRAYLGQLLSLNAIIPQGSGYVRDSRLRPLGRLYALEAKVSDWSGGVRQAVRYSGWADAAALVVLRPPSNVGEMVIRARRLHIGLAVGSTWLIKPKIETQGNASRRGARLLASEHFYASMIRAPGQFD